MKKQEVVKLYKDAFAKNPLAIGIITLIVVVILVLAIRSVVKKLKISGLQTLDVKNVPDGSRPTLTQAEIDSVAASQLRAMNTTGTDEDELISSIERLNGADLRRVYKAFGTKSRSSFWGRSVLTGGTDLDLLGWYRAELNPEDSDDRRYLNILQDIWKRAGITI